MRWIAALIALAAAIGLGLTIADRLDAPEKTRRAPGPAAVEVAPVERAAITARRTFSGSLEAGARFVVSAEVGGRVERLAVDLGDRVEPGQVLAVLDAAEFEQAVAAARAELAVAEARLGEARSAATIADRALERSTTLRQRGVASEDQLDRATAEQLGAAAAVDVARAEVQRARAGLEAARIRLGYTEVVARWPGRAAGDDAGPSDPRHVARRMVDAGARVPAGAPLLTLVDLDPLVAVLSVTERDYGGLEVGRPVTLTTDAHPGQRFAGRVSRIAPAFDPDARQARVEVEVPNADHRLRPGMFARVELAVRAVRDATVVPEEALTVRREVDGVFVVEGEPPVARWRPVTVGIRDGGRVQVSGEGVEGRVITLGQQLVDDGAPVTMPAPGPGEAR